MLGRVGNKVSSGMLAPFDVIMIDREQQQFVQQLIQVQPRLEVYVRSLVAGADVADDIVQRTNLVLCQKSGEFADGGNFGAWACKVAYFEVLSYRQGQARERLVFDDELLRELASLAEEETQDMGRRLKALRDCLGRLPAKARELLDRRYGAGETVQNMATRLGRTAASISQTLYRFRLALLDCVQLKLISSENHG